jgi:hypothetical protein
MASIDPDTRVHVDSAWLRSLAFAPSSRELFVAVHQSALRAPSSALTLVLQVTSITTPEVIWAGALDEGMLTAPLGPAPALSGARSLLGPLLMRGAHLWECITPGHLLRATAAQQTLSVYRGSRPWIVVGELANEMVLAVPLNDARGGGKWYAPAVSAEDLPTQNPKPSQAELAHLWAFPATVHRIGSLGAASHAPLASAIEAYYR